MKESIFPTITKGKWIKINLNEESKKSSLDFVNPNACYEWIKGLHKQKGVSYSYGGYLEDRSNIWKNHYQKFSKAFIHLGMDYNVPEESFVSLFDSGTVEDVFMDKDHEGGWGGRVMWRMDSGIYAIYGHLKQNVKLKVGQKCKKGEVIGVVGSSVENGGWYPHLHVQLMKPEFVTHFSNLRDLDGYLPKESKLLGHLLDPEKFIKVTDHA